MAELFERRIAGVSVAPARTQRTAYGGRPVDAEASSGDNPAAIESWRKVLEDFAFPSLLMAYSAGCATF